MGREMATEKREDMDNSLNNSNQTKAQAKISLAEIMNPSEEELKDWEQRWDKNHEENQD